MLYYHLRSAQNLHAGVAQLVEQLICNQQVGGSSPSTSSIPDLSGNLIIGRVPERPKGADCKSAVNDFGGSNPPSSTTMEKSELNANRQWVRIFCFYSGYFILRL